MLYGVIIQILFQLKQQLVRWMKSATLLKKQQDVQQRRTNADVLFQNESKIFNNYMNECIRYICHLYECETFLFHHQLSHTTDCGFIKK